MKEQVCEDTINRCSFECIRKQLEEKSKLLAKAEIAIAIGVDYDNVRILMLEVAELMDIKSLMWQQRSRALHLRLRDSNTQIFHNKASQRNRDGVYSIESGYQFLLDEDERDSPGPSSMRRKVLNDGMCLSCKLQQVDPLCSLVLPSVEGSLERTV
nr:hypothetical protein CFP56_72005 [Quercus suber]